jgi:hypothetical protein
VRHTGKAPPLRKTGVSRLTEGLDFGEDRVAKHRSLPGLVPVRDPPLTGRVSCFWVLKLPTRPTQGRRSGSRLRTVACGQASVNPGGVQTTGWSPPGVQVNVLVQGLRPSRRTPPGDHLDTRWTKAAPYQRCLDGRQGRRG